MSLGRRWSQERGDLVCPDCKAESETQRRCSQCRMTAREICNDLLASFFFMSKYQHDPLAVYPSPPCWTPEQLDRDTAEMWAKQLASAAAKIAKVASWNDRTGGTQRVVLDCLEVHALHAHLAVLPNKVITDSKSASAAPPTA